MSSSRIYMDNNATTMVDPLVFKAMEPFFVEKYGNPNSLHTFGTEVHPAMNTALNQIYEALNASDDDDIFITSCATESNNTVLKSIFFSEVLPKKKTQIIITSVEHPTIVKTAEYLGKCGADVVVLPVNEDGIVAPEALEEAIDKNGNCALVSIMFANNETGLKMPVIDLCKIAHKYGALFHTDATQGFGKVRVDVKEIGCDFLSLSAHKFHGPKGVGALYVKHGIDIVPLFHGGEQMHGKRAGTVNVPFMVGLGLAMKLANDFLAKEETYVTRLRDKLEDAILKIPNAMVIGKRELRLPNTILCSFKGVEGEALLWDLNKNGLAASTGSACASESLEPNPTFVAMKICTNLAHTGLRLSLSRFNTEEEVDKAIEIITNAVTRLRDISGQH